MKPSITIILILLAGMPQLSLRAQEANVPSNDRYLDVQPVDLSLGEAIVFTSDNTGATIDDDFVPGSVADINWGVASVWHAFHLDQPVTVVVDYCGTDFQQPGAFADYLFPDRPDAREALAATTIYPSPCGDGNYTMTFTDLFAGTYYIAVGYLPSIAEGSYTLTVSATTHPCEQLVSEDVLDR